MPPPFMTSCLKCASFSKQLKDWKTSNYWPPGCEFFWRKRNAHKEESRQVFSIAREEDFEAKKIASHCPFLVQISPL